MLHLKSFFPSWTDAMCIFKSPFRVKFALHMLHLKGFFSFMNWCKVFIQLSLLCKAWITCRTWMAFFLHAICSFDLLFSAKLVSHMLHLKGFFPSWTNATWPFICPFCVKLELHMLHLNGSFPSWTDAMCSFNFFFLFWHAPRKGWCHSCYIPMTLKIDFSGIDVCHFFGLFMYLPQSVVL